jgi:hypothetical protein
MVYNVIDTYYKSAYYKSYYKSSIDRAKHLKLSIQYYMIQYIAMMQDIFLVITKTGTIPI